MKKFVKAAFGMVGLEVSRKGHKLSNPVMDYIHATRLLYFGRLSKLVEDIPGDFVECGVGRGRSLIMLLSLVRAKENGRKVWAFDSFQGFPAPSPEDINREWDNSAYINEGNWNDTSVPGLHDMLLRNGFNEQFLSDHLVIVPGFFENTMERFIGDEIALLHVDVDLYSSYITVLGALYPKVNIGGVIACDEYGSETDLLKFPGAKLAIDQFAGDTNSQFQEDPVTKKHYVVKWA